MTAPAVDNCVRNCGRELPRALDQELGEVLVVGIGNELRGDDDAGNEVARLVAEQDACEVIIAEDVPENYLGPMKQARARTIIFCDVVDLGKAPGSVDVLDIEELAGASVSTHNSSLGLVARCLYDDGVQRVLIAAIQPRSMGWGARMTDVVREATVTLADMLVEAVGSKQCEEQ